MASRKINIILSIGIPISIIAFIVFSKSINGNTIPKELTSETTPIRENEYVSDPQYIPSENRTGIEVFDEFETLIIMEFSRSGAIKNPQQTILDPVIIIDYDQHSIILKNDISSEPETIPYQQVRDIKKGEFQFEIDSNEWAHLITGESFTIYVDWEDTGDNHKQVISYMTIAAFKAIPKRSKGNY